MQCSRYDVAFIWSIKQFTLQLLTAQAMLLLVCGNSEHWRWHGSLQRQREHAHNVHCVFCVSQSMCSNWANPSCRQHAIGLQCLPDQPSKLANGLRVTPPLLAFLVMLLLCT
jgi:hypothetical protein